ncbi:MAG: glycyl-radical enzyme activating protein [Prolixibacteraceae bacterium]|jgi:pyruvate formate lyase activating enzyme|nr:glycyl-radical enzyme activating protein [Prolixibacteraceae bacterium]
MNEQTAVLTEIRSLSAHDGPGLRTTIFFKGCSLKCKWCHNPETILLTPELEWDEKSCIDCRVCEANCPEKAIAFTESKSYIINKNKCTVCGTCLATCPSKALKISGISYTVDQLFERIHKDEKFIKRSNGGITFSGGEPALRYPFIVELAKKLKAFDYHLALDTCGVAPAKAYKTIVPLMDLILYDLKEINDEKHRQFTGASNELVHENLSLILKLIQQNNLKTEVWIRTPLIPAMTDTYENVQAIGKFLSEKANGSVQKWELCTFNNLCIAKYRKLGKEWALEHSDLLTTSYAAQLLKVAKLSAPIIPGINLSGLTKNK